MAGDPNINNCALTWPGNSWWPLHPSYPYLGVHTFATSSVIPEKTIEMPKDFTDEEFEDFPHEKYYIPETDNPFVNRDALAFTLLTIRATTAEQKALLADFQDRAEALIRLEQYGDT